MVNLGENGQKRDKKGGAKEILHQLCAPREMK